MLRARINMFGGAVWGATPEARFRVPDSVEAQETVLKALLETPLGRQRRNPLDWLVSVILHAILLAAVTVAPLCFTQVMDLHSLQLTYLVTPSPPAAAPPAAPTAVAQKIAPRKPMSVMPSKLVAPVVIPQKVIVVQAPDVTPELVGGVIGGVPGGATGGVLNGIIGGSVEPSAPGSAASPTVPKKEGEILHIGGDVRPPRQLFAPAPKYPALAKAAQVHGTVLIDAVIDELGNVVDVHAVEGNPLLIPEALKTVIRWKYEPTYLNGVPYQVQLTVSVNFTFAS